ncbi:hypothetical protein B0H10DRAFT_2123488 [Mycena sp. CBHHK59/15]|nr:hypothetical protein B0H10DRAFT_2123488 [Mycena sp. CBHHK59/15]
MADTDGSTNPYDEAYKCYVDCQESGFYESVLDQMKAMPNALANLEYIGTKKRKPDIFRGEDWSKNIVFKDGPGKDASEYRVAVLGEIAEPRDGTLVRAHGNHFDGREGEPFKPVDDKAKVKDVLVLHAPTHCNLDLKNFFDNQTAFVQDLENTEIVTDKANGWTPNFRSSLRSSRTDMDAKDLMTILTQKKYAIPASAGGPRVVETQTPQRVQRVKRKFGDDDEDDDEEDSSSDTPPSTKSPSQDDTNTIKYPTDNEIKIGAFYDPRVLEDYGGEYFSHINAKLQQLDIRDANNKLIPPWKQYTALRPGSIVLALVTIHVYTFKDQGFDRNRDRKIVQLNAHTIRVLDESDFPVEKRRRPVPRTLVDGPSGSRGPSTPKKSAGGGFNDFVVTPRSSPNKAAPGSGTQGDEESPAGKKQRKTRK